MVQFLYWIPSDGNPILSLFNFYLSQCHIFETSPKISFLQHLGLIPTSYFLDDWDFSQMRCPLLSQMSWFFWKWMDWDKEWCKCFGSVSWCPKGIGKICRGLKKISYDHFLVLKFVQPHRLARWSRWTRALVAVSFRITFSAASQTKSLIFRTFRANLCCFLLQRLWTMTQRQIVVMTTIIVIMLIIWVGHNWSASALI